MNGHKKLYRSCKDRILAGVCGGLSEYFEIDPLIFRLLFIFLGFEGIGILAYIVFALVVPNDPECSHNHSSGINRDTVREFANNIKESAESVANGSKSKHRRGRGRYVFGLILVAIGILALIDQILPFDVIRWRYIWPLALVFVGIFIIFRRRNNE